MNDYEFVKDEVTSKEDVIMVINDWYNNSNSCEYVLPVNESAPVMFEITKEKIEDPSKVFHNVDYTL